MAQRETAKLKLMLMFLFQASNFINKIRFLGGQFRDLSLKIKYIGKQHELSFCYQSPGSRACKAKISQRNNNSKIKITGGSSVNMH